MERLSDRAIEILNELYTERLSYNSEYMPLIEAALQLAAYEGAEEQGRLVVFPCKVGDTCYIAGNDGERIVECKINYITLSDDGIEYVLDSVCGENCDGCPFDDYHQDMDGEYYCSCEYGDVSVSPSDFGKIVFLSREEAEAALKQKQDTEAEK